VRRTVRLVNVSSLLGIKPAATFALYCGSKAARKMTTEVVALENPSIRVVSYSPGVMRTAMHGEIRDGPPSSTRDL
jgi:sepiapterin reductase